jgi:hypothetical protein
MLPAGAQVPIEGPCQAVDFELEMVRTQQLLLDKPANLSTPRWHVALQHY